ncbi:hypothetical protein MY4824_004449, partial [Beauveria thailandica]
MDHGMHLLALWGSLVTMKCQLMLTCQPASVGTALAGM